MVFVSKGMILAAGYGTRLEPLTKGRPKPLMEVMGHPLLVYALQNMKAAGCKEVIINTHHLGHQIREQLGETYEGIQLYYSDEKKILGTGGGIKKAQHFLENEKAFLVIQGDVIADFHPSHLMQSHFSHSSLATLGLKTLNDMMGYGAVGTDETDRILTISNWVPYEGPVYQKRFFCGIHLLSSSIFSFLPKEEVFCGITDQIYPELIQKQQPLYGAEIEGAYWDVGTPKRLWEANMKLLRGEIQLQHLRIREGYYELKKNIFVRGNAPISPQAHLEAPLLIEEGVHIGAYARVGPAVVLGKNSRVGSGAQLSNSVVFSGAQVEAGEKLKNSLIDKTERVTVSD